jgi:hypothetical protein
VDDEATRLLRDALAYLKREDTSVPGIGAVRDGQGNLEGPEKRRFLIAERIENYLATL